jgi:hypothetical protein
MQTIRETTQSPFAQVDCGAGVLRGVKILGRESRNGREYAPAALEQAARLYQGRAVNLNHARGEGEERPVEAAIGWLESVELRADGVYGDLHYLKSHPHAACLVEAALRNPRRFGLSHHAVGRVARRAGREVVESIERVRSVDVVQNPATNNGLFESEDPMPKTIEEILGSADLPGCAGLLEREGLQVLAGQAIEADEGRQLPSALAALVEALLNQPLGSLREKLARVRKLLERLEADPEARDAQTGAAPGGVPTLAELVERIERIETEAQCRALLEARNRHCDATRLQALCAAPIDQREKLVESWPERGVEHHRRRPAVSAPLGADPVSRFPADTNGFVALLR